MLIIHSVNTLLKRALESRLSAALRSFPAVVVTGARQTGKSTLVQRLLPGPRRRYLTLDDLDVLARAEAEPDALIEGEALLTIDEVQRSPGLLLAVKRAIDRKRVPGRFVLTGSANLLLMRRVGETLAGRAVHLTLLPLTRREQLGLGRTGLWAELLHTPDREWPRLLDTQTVPDQDWRDLARRGGYPTPAHELTEPEARALWFTGYTQTYLERDLRDLANVASVVDFRRLMRAACLRLGNLVNQAELGRDIGLSQPTVHRHLDLLEVSHQLVRLPAFARNRTKRLVKTPKAYWTDSGLALHLAGEADPRGAHLENVVLGDLLAWRGLQTEAGDVSYWRTATNEEVDFVIEQGNRLLPVEVKATPRPRLADARALQSFRAEYAGQTRAGLLLHTGRETSWMADGVLAVPWWRVI